MNLNQLRQFLAVAEAENITKAAENLYITQPALSAAISRLENELGVKLFDRQKNSLSINESGKLLYDRAESILRKFDNGLRNIEDIKNQRQGEIKFSLPDAGLLRNIKQEYLSSHPDNRFGQSLMSASYAKKYLLAGTIHFALSYYQISDPMIEWRDLAKVKLGLASYYDKSEEGESIGLSELSDRSFVFCGTSTDVTELFVQKCKAAGFNPRILFTGDDLVLIRHLLREHEAILVLPNSRGMSDERRASGGLYPIPLKEPLACVGLGIATAKNTALPRRAAEFISFIEQRLPQEYSHI